MEETEKKRRPVWIAVEIFQKSSYLASCLTRPVHLCDLPSGRRAPSRPNHRVLSQPGQVYTTAPKPPLTTGARPPLTVAARPPLTTGAPPPRPAPRPHPRRDRGRRSPQLRRPAGRGSASPGAGAGGAKPTLEASLALKRRGTGGTRSPFELAQASAEARKQIASVVSATRSPFGTPKQLSTDQAGTLERSLRELEMKLVEREHSMAELENRLAERERDVAEAEALPGGPRESRQRRPAGGAGEGRCFQGGAGGPRSSSRRNSIGRRRR